MALNKNGMDLKAINRDQKAIDKLPNHGRAKTQALHKAKMGKKDSWEEAKKVTKGIHQLGLKDIPRHKTLSGKEVKY